MMMYEMLLEMSFHIIMTLMEGAKMFVFPNTKEVHIGSEQCVCMQGNAVPSGSL
jgi:hypothetical protein